ncbi:MAG: hypothetical protein MK078_02615 [Crocinitomicaceae bacterium]|nr:hypothetical protein [Crocinitomicaceae bacterium]
MTGTLNVGAESFVNLGGGVEGPMTFGTISLASEAQLDIQNASSTTTMANLSLSTY